MRAPTIKTHIPIQGFFFSGPTPVSWGGFDPVQKSGLMESALQLALGQFPRSFEGL